MDLSIIIVNFNGNEILPRCLDSLVAVRNELEFEVVVVDNGSTEGIPDDFISRYSDFKFFGTGRNLGFAGACNFGMAEAKGRHVMLLNPDTEVVPGALRALVDALDSHPEWGIVGPRMVDENDRPYPAARRFPRPLDVFCESTRLIYCFPRSKFFASYFYGGHDLTTLDEVDQVEGSALVIKGSVRQKIGDLDPQFFLFWEEVDWCKRVKNAGYETHVVQSAVVRHFRATTMSRFYINSRTAHAESAMKFFRKHHGEKGLTSLRRWMMPALWMREVGSRIVAFFGNRELAKLRAEGARAERVIYRRGLEA